MGRCFHGLPAGFQSVASSLAESNQKEAAHNPAGFRMAAFSSASMAIPVAAPNRLQQGLSHAWRRMDISPKLIKTNPLQKL